MRFRTKFKQIKPTMKILKILLSVFFLITICEQGFSQTTATGMASYYHDNFEGKTTANGDIYRKDKLTAAHQTLPFNTKVKVTNLSNNRSVIVTINDRGPFAKNRIIDLSKAAAIKLDFIDKGTTKVTLEVIKEGK